MISAVTLYWWLFAVASLTGLLCLYKLHRLTEPGGHHLYWGMMLAVFPWWPLRIFALALVVDDAVQHWVQARDLDDGRLPRPDWSPAHRAYVWLYVHIARLLS